jgi:hypothetical protein
MKKCIPFLLLAATSVFVSSSHAQILASAIFTDTAGDVFTDAGGGILDITSVEVSNTATDLIFKISLAGNPVDADWGKYLVGFDTGAGGDTASNGWGRPIAMSSGMNYWVGTWADGGNGGEVHSFGGTEWTRQSATWDANPDGIGLAKDSSSVTIQLSFVGLGLGLGDSFSFDVYTSGGGGGDGAIDALSNPNQTVSDWGDLYDSGTLLSSYTLIPEPGTYAAIFGGLALLSAFVYRRRLNAKK